VRFIPLMMATVDCKTSETTDIYLLLTERS
jgi:hypothetical protein